MQFTHTNSYNEAFEAFRRAHSRANIQRLIAGLCGKRSTLLDFAAFADREYQDTRYLGLMEIPTAKITGSVGRAHDFDANFRPLKRHLCTRWVAIALAQGSDGPTPIQIYKVGDKYFVKDGHHRISVARCFGVDFIDAEIWEYLPKKEQRAYTLKSQCPERAVRPRKQAPTARKVYR